MSRETCGYEPCNVLERSNVTKVHCSLALKQVQNERSLYREPVALTSPIWLPDGMYQRVGLAPEVECLAFNQALMPVIRLTVSAYICTTTPQLWRTSLDCASCTFSSTTATHPRGRVLQMS